MERQVMTQKQLLLIAKIVENGPYPEVDTFARALMAIYELPPGGARQLEEATRVARKRNINLLEKIIVITS